MRQRMVTYAVFAAVLLIAIRTYERRTWSAHSKTVLDEVPAWISEYRYETIAFQKRGRLPRATL
jgi:hypothetical protein